jgi:hypothetical protein
MNHQQNSTSTLTGFNSAMFDEASFMRFLDQTTKSHHDEDSYLESFKAKSISGAMKQQPSTLALRFECDQLSNQIS